jgi:hypothetical protein
MQIILYILLSVTGLLIFIEDVRTRLVTVWKILLILLISGVICVLSRNDFSSILKSVSINISVITIVYLALVLFYFLKERKFSFALKEKAGLADGLLFLAPAFCFSNVLFLYFILISVVGALVYSIVRRIASASKQITIPLAGITSLLFCISIIALDALQIDRLDDAAIFEKFILP